MLIDANANRLQQAIAELEKKYSHSVLKHYAFEYEFRKYKQFLS